MLLVTVVININSYYLISSQHGKHLLLPNEWLLMSILEGNDSYLIHLEFNGNTLQSV